MFFCKLPMKEKGIMVSMSRLHANKFLIISCYSEITKTASFMLPLSGILNIYFFNMYKNPLLIKKKYKL